MTIVDQIHLRVQSLPENFQKEALHFVEFLTLKMQQGQTEPDDGKSWSHFSLTMAMRGMEEEKGPEYSLDDLKETFK